MKRLRGLWAGMPRRDRRALVLGLAIVAVALAVVRIVPGLVRTAAVLRERAATARSAVQSAREAIAAGPTMRESLAVRGQRLAGWAPRLLGGSSTAEAQAELAAWLSGSAAVHNVRVLRQDVGADSSVSLFQRLTQRVEAEGDISGVVGWLGAIESDQRLAQVASMRVNALDPAASGAERLHVELVIHAWAIVRERPAS